MQQQNKIDIFFMQLLVKDKEKQDQNCRPTVVSRASNGRWTRG
jgi:hypothetical protein